MQAFIFSDNWQKNLTYPPRGTNTTINLTTLPRINITK